MTGYLREHLLYHHGVSSSVGGCQDSVELRDGNNQSGIQQSGQTFHQQFTFIIVIAKLSLDQSNFNSVGKGGVKKKVVDFSV